MQYRAMFVAAALLSVAACEDDPPETEVTPAEMAATDLAATADTGDVEALVLASGVPVSLIMDDPAAWNGRTVGGDVVIEEVPTDRGFWVSDGQRRMFALLMDRPAERPMHVQAGDTLQLVTGTVHASDSIMELPGAALDQRTRTILRSQPAFLLVDEADLRTIRHPAATPAPDTARR